MLSLQTPAAAGTAAAGAAPDSVLSMQLVGASAAPPVVGQDPLPGTSYYFLGNDPSQWHTDIPGYAQVEEKSVFPGVDLVYYGNQQQLEYNFTVAPRAAPGVIRMAFMGAESAMLDAQGNLVLQTTGGPVVEQTPVLYQEQGGVRQAGCSPCSARRSWRCPSPAHASRRPSSPSGSARGIGPTPNERDGSFHGSRVVEGHAAARKKTKKNKKPRIQEPVE
jgi:hypothetical protein